MFQRNKQDIMEIATKSCRWFIICSFSLPPSPIYIFIHSPILDGRTGNRGVFLFPGPVSDTNLFLRRVSVELYALSHALLKPPSWHASNHQNPNPGETKILSEGEWVTMRFQTTHMFGQALCRNHWNYSIRHRCCIFIRPLHSTREPPSTNTNDDRPNLSSNSTLLVLVSSRLECNKQDNQRRGFNSTMTPEEHRHGRATMTNRNNCQVVAVLIPTLL